MATIFVKIILIAFFINVVWELLHSSLYTTCHHMPIKDYRWLMLKMSAKDALWIALFYSLTFIIFRNIDILSNYWQLATFIILGLLFSFFDERVSLKLKRWDYARSMPTILGVGITPLLEIVITGAITFIIVFRFFI